MSKPLLTDTDFCRASKRLRCAVAAIRGVAQTESAKSGFYADGFPVILFERHLFRKFTNGRYNQDYPEISGPPGGYGAAGQNQRRKFAVAFALNPDAAMKSCSWGKFQILGSNHKVCGYNTVGEFVDGMKESEGKHLDAFVGFVIGNHLDGHLRNHDWAKFARGYNGPGFAKNNYHIKMANAFAKFSKEDIDCSTISAAAKPSGDSTTNDLSISEQSSLDKPADAAADTAPIEPTPGATETPIVTKIEKTTTETDEGTSVVTKTQQEQTTPAVSVVPVKPTIWSMLIAFGTTIYGYYTLAKENFGTLVDRAQDAIDIRFVMNAAVGAGLVVLGIWLYNKSRNRAAAQTKNLIDAAADQSKNTVVLVDKPVDVEVPAAVESA